MRTTIREQLANVHYVGKPKKVANNTVKYNRWHDGATVYRLHRTDIVVIEPDGTYTLNSGGWRTITTKDRINTFSPVNIFQRKGEWFIGLGPFNEGIPFKDGMRVDAKGAIIEPRKEFTITFDGKWEDRNADNR